MVNLIINGPFEHTTTYLDNLNIKFGPELSLYQIKIIDSNLKYYKYFSFKMRQTLTKYPWDSIFVYVTFDETNEMLPMKGSPSQVYEFLEYRVKIPETIQNELIINFSQKSYHYSFMNLTELKFGPNVNNFIDDFNLPITLKLYHSGPGEISPFAGRIPTYEGEIIEIKARAYNDCVVDRIIFEGNVLNENGILYPSLIQGNNLQTFRPFKVLSSFIHKGSIYVYFKEGR